MASDSREPQASETAREMMMTTLPNNLSSIEDVRMMGLAGLAYLGETSEQPKETFSDDNRNSLSVYSDDSVWLSANISEVYPSVGDYLAECSGDDDRLTAQLREWCDESVSQNPYSDQWYSRGEAGFGE